MTLSTPVLAVGYIDSGTSPDLIEESFVVQLNSGGGDFSSSSNLHSLATSFGCADSAGYNRCRVAIGDLNGDGKGDVAVANYIGLNKLLLQASSDGSFSELTSSPATVEKSSSAAFEATSQVALADVNADGHLDLLFVNYQQNGQKENRLLTNDGVAGFTEVNMGIGFGGSSNKEAVLGDFDGDGDLDFIGTNLQMGVSHFANNGAGSFSSVSGTTIPSAINSAISGDNIPPIAADVNGDGRLDFLYFKDPVQVALNSDNGAFIQVQGTVMGGGDLVTLAMAVADLDGDGKLRS